ncbi:hypothetical protein F4804DRAFT_348730 [Jackrogersella minutella]|nr:hypothetical protein F4804DRAFT_348730 [Jackrogersella minutella]
MYMTMKGLFKFIPKEGWRRTGTFNLILLSCYGLVLLVCFAIAISRSPTLDSTTIIFEGDCQKTKNLNLVLHFLLNLISTLTLASSSYFMQILSAPSRQEIDRAHSRLRSLDIGVSSLKNIRLVSPLKTLGWLVLSISSIPIHLLFNSSIFQTSYQGSDWQLTIASSGFGVQEIEFFLPGASLANAGVPGPGLNASETYDPECNYESGYGEYVSLTEYWNTSSPVYQGITKTANEYKSWHNITPQACHVEYASFIVVDTGTDNSNGWTRSQVFSDPHDDLGLIWDPHIPRNNVNSLWYSTLCTTNLYTATESFDADTLACANGCFTTLGMRGTDMLTNMTSSDSNWTIAVQRDYVSPCVSTRQQELGYNNTFNTFDVKYCLEQPSSNDTCRVGLSNLLLFTTIICIILKAITCTIVIYYLSNTSLVTLGDTLESFITIPDPVTLGLGTFTIHDSHRLQFGKRTIFGPDDTIELSDTIVPRIWHRKTTRLISTLPKSTWSGTFAPILFFIGIGGYFTSQIYMYDGSSFRGAFGESDSPFFIGDYVGDYGFTATLLIANLPQFILSYCFLSYSSLFTRMLAEKEFNSYSLAPHKPLRVSYPVGHQTSTYWLQLPYIFSVPLLTMSTLLHWFATNSIFLFAPQGGK